VNPNQYEVISSNATQYNTRSLLFRTKNNCLAVVVGNHHSQFFIVGYIKYCSTTHEKIWRRGGDNYERLVKTYTPRVVREYTEWKTYIPFYDSEVPVIPADTISKIYDPVMRTLELHSRIQDTLEEIALEFTHEVESNTSVLPGITGSLLPGIHNPSISDLDFIVYGAKNSLDVIEFISENRDVFQEFKSERLAKWSRDVAIITGLSPREVVKFYRNWRRGVFRGKEYSVIYNNGVRGEIFTLPAYKTLGRVKLVVEIRGGLEALNYPSLSEVLSYKLLEAGIINPFDIGEILSFEASIFPGYLRGIV